MISAVIMRDPPNTLTTICMIVLHCYTLDYNTELVPINAYNIVIRNDQNMIHHNDHPIHMMDTSFTPNLDCALHVWGIQCKLSWKYFTFNCNHE